MECCVSMRARAEAVDVRRRVKCIGGSEGVTRRRALGEEFGEAEDGGGSVLTTPSSTQRTRYGSKSWSPAPQTCECCGPVLLVGSAVPEPEGSINVVRRA
jgi:hypothetical protein